MESIGTMWRCSASYLEGTKVLLSAEYSVKALAFDDLSLFRDMNRYKIHLTSTGINRTKISLYISIGELMNTKSNRSDLTCMHKVNLLSEHREYPHWSRILSLVKRVYMFPNLELHSRKNQTYSRCRWCDG